MSAFFSIELEGLRFFAPHGVYEGEALTGNEFEVDLYLQTDGTVPVAHLEQTVNYAEVYALVRAIMQKREALLEVLCQQIAGTIHRHFPQVREVQVRIRKRTPAIPHFSGTVGVSLTERFNP